MIDHGLQIIVNGKTYEFNFAMKSLFKIAFSASIVLMLSSVTTFKTLLTSQPVSNFLAGRDDSTKYDDYIQVDSFRLKIVPPSSGVQFYKDGIVFLSFSKDEKKMTPNQISFGNAEAYYASVGDSSVGKHAIFSPSYPFSYPCDGMTFSSDYSTVYFTMIPKNTTNEKIFMARFIANSKGRKDLVEESRPLDFCNDNYNYSHPALSGDGNMMVFASDREGSYGGMDLYMIKQAEGKWSVPENMGKLINTAGNEFFPFLDKDNNLFFSSDGQPGYGGYDIFTCKFNGSGWEKPVNLSDHINSDGDDIAFTINRSDGKSGFLTRRQKAGPRELQLFRVTLKQGIPDRNLLTLSYIFDGKPVAVASISSVSVAEAKPKETESRNLKTDTLTAKKEELKVPEKALPLKKVPGKTAANKTEPGGKLPIATGVIIKPSKPLPARLKDVVVYRVQFLSANMPKKENEVEINGKSYPLYEYFYLGSYRYAVGEFTTLAPAIELQRICRQSGYPQAFVAAFKNDTRSLDLKSFK
jgi:hypothetical protein